MTLALALDPPPGREPGLTWGTYFDARVERGVSGAGQAAEGTDPVFARFSLRKGEPHDLENAYAPRCRIFDFHDVSCFRARWRWWWRWWRRWHRRIGVRIGRVSVKQCWRTVGSGRDNTEQPPDPVKIPARYARHWRKRLGWCWPVRFRRRQRVERIADRFAWLGQGVARKSLVSRAFNTAEGWSQIQRRFPERHAGKEAPAELVRD
jgi:hypothetical protein